MMKCRSYCKVFFPFKPRFKKMIVARRDADSLNDIHHKPFNNDTEHTEHACMNTFIFIPSKYRCNVH